MASGDVVGIILDILPLAANAATPDRRAGGSSPAEQVRVWDFDAASDEYLDFKVVLEGYGGGGLTCTLVWSASTATSGNVVWDLAIRRMQDDAEDIDSSHTYAFNSVTAGAPSASGEVGYDDITFTDGADMDSWADGELAIVRLRRNGDDASDTMADDAELWGLVVKET